MEGENIDRDEVGNGELADETIQTGGRTIEQQAADKLNEAFGKHKHKREWGRALEELKRAAGLNNNHHGKLKANGDYYSDNGKLIGNIGEYMR